MMNQTVPLAALLITLIFAGSASSENGKQNLKLTMKYVYKFYFLFLVTLWINFRSTTAQI